MLIPTTKRMKMMIMATVILMENCQTKITLATALHASLENTKIVQIIGGRPAKNNRRAAEVKSFKAPPKTPGIAIQVVAPTLTWTLAAIETGRAKLSRHVLEEATSRAIRSHHEGRAILVEQIHTRTTRTIEAKRANLSLTVVLVKE